MIELYVGGGHLQKNRCWAPHVPSEVWLHLVAAYDGTVREGPNQRLYLNGRLVHKTRNEARLLRESELTPIPLAGEVPDGLIPLKLPLGATRSIESVIDKALSVRGQAVHAPLRLSDQAVSLDGIPFRPASGGAWQK